MTSAAAEGRRLARLVGSRLPALPHVGVSDGTVAVDDATAKNVNRVTGVLRVCAVRYVCVCVCSCVSVMTDGIAVWGADGVVVGGSQSTRHARIHTYTYTCVPPYTYMCTAPLTYACVPAPPPECRVMACRPAGGGCICQLEGPEVGGC